jgi:hypothetical protein
MALGESDARNPESGSGDADKYETYAPPPFRSDEIPARAGSLGEAGEPAEVASTFAGDDVPARAGEISEGGEE